MSDSGRLRLQSRGWKLGGPTLGELQSRLSLSLSPAPRSGERAVVILIHQKLLFHLRPSCCVFDFCFCCFCRASLILLSWIRVTVLSCLALVHPLFPIAVSTAPNNRPLSSFVPWTVLGI